MFYHSNEIINFNYDSNLLAFFSKHHIEQIKGIYEYFSWLFIDRNALVQHFQGKHGRGINSINLIGNKADNLKTQPSKSVLSGPADGVPINSPSQHGIVTSATPTNRVLDRSATVLARKRTIASRQEYQLDVM